VIIRGVRPGVTVAGYIAVKMTQEDEMPFSSSPPPLPPVNLPLGVERLRSVNVRFYTDMRRR
jgi:hypothetical protein